MKTCPKCKRRKRRDQFRRRSSHSPYLVSWCRPCERDNRVDYPRTKWSQLAWNVRRKTGTGPTATELRLGLGEPESCYLCGGALDWDGAEVDHVIPQSRGGQSTLDNLAWSHRRCNRLKHDITVDELRELLPVILDHLEATS